MKIEIQLDDEYFYNRDNRARLGSAPDIVHGFSVTPSIKIDAQIDDNYFFDPNSRDRSELQSLVKEYTNVIDKSN